MNSNSSLMTLGADPERFIWDKRSGEAIPVCGWLGGTKAAPKPLGKYAGYFVQEDNVMAEYNIPVTTDVNSFTSAITTAEKELAKLVSAHDSNYEVSPLQVAIFPERVLVNTPGANVFGCSPEYDAYTEGGQVPTAVMPKLGGSQHSALMEERYAGGHLHLGITDVKGVYTDVVPRYVFAALCDASIGLAMCPHDRQGGRRKVYGQAGRFRPTKYGIEYRVLSNFWTNNVGVAEAVADSAFGIMRFLAREDLSTVRRTFDQIPWGAVREAINTEDYRASRHLYGYIWTEITGRMAA